MNVNRKIMALAAGLLALAMIAGDHIALAQENSRTTSIAVVDVQFLMQNSAAAENARAQFEKMLAYYQQVIEGTMEGITKAYETIVNERPTLSDDAYQQRLAELRQMAANFQNDALEHQGKLDGALREALQKIADAIEQVVDQIMKEQKLTVVLPRSAIIGTPAVPDITQKVLEYLNQRIPTVAVDLPN